MLQIIRYKPSSLVKMTNSNFLRENMAIKLKKAENMLDKQSQTAKQKGCPSAGRLGVGLKSLTVTSNTKDRGLKQFVWNESGDCTEMAQDMVQRRGTVKTLMNLRVPLKLGIS
jgi:hypothetical protein